jgi:mRNA interferase MazF
VHEIALPRRRGHVQHGRRYAEIVQADALLSLSTAVICPTSSASFAASFHPQITLRGEPTQVLCEMVGAVDVRALGRHVAHLTLDEMRDVEDSLALVLDLG